MGPPAIARAALLSSILLAACAEETPAADDLPRAAEAGFLEIPAVEYTLRGGEIDLAATTSRARLFFSFRPADDRPDDRPLIVLHSGGPGASTAILLGGNTGPTTLDAARTGDGDVATNPHSWTTFANLLFVDARGAGFSYGLAPGAESEDVRAAEISVRNFNPFVDAADLVRATLAFLRERPHLRSRPIVFAGESYAGIRTSIALHMLHHPERYAAGASPYEDAALAAEIAAHFAEAGATADEQAARAILLQPRLSSPQQQAAAGAALEAEGSPIHDVAAETGVPFVPCADEPPPCSPFANVIDYLDAVGRDVYDVRRPAGDAFARYDAIGARLEDPTTLPLVIGVEPAAIEGLAPAAREGAYRLIQAAPEAEPLSATLGDLAPHDRYFEVELFDLIGAPFAGAEAKALGVERQNGRFGLFFLEDLLDVRFFVTSAAFDAVIWTPSLPAALAMYTTHVAGVHMQDDDVAVDYAPGAFGLEGGAARSFRLRPYGASGHSVSLDEPDRLAADVAEWLAE